MASVTLKRGTKAEIESTQIQDGQLLMETDQLNNNKIYLDLPNGTRVPVGGSGAWVGTKEEFELAVEEGKIADGTQVIITDDYESGITASMTLYSNSQSGLVATNVQSAIDEVSAKIGQENISQVGNSVTGAINNLNSNLNEKIEKIFEGKETGSLSLAKSILYYSAIIFITSDGMYYFKPKNNTYLYNCDNYVKIGTDVNLNCFVHNNGTSLTNYVTIYAILGIK